MRCRGFNHQLAAKRSFCGPCPGLCRRAASGWRALLQMRQNGLGPVRVGELPLPICILSMPMKILLYSWKNALYNYHSQGFFSFRSKYFVSEPWSFFFSFFGILHLNYNANLFCGDQN